MTVDTNLLNEIAVEAGKKVMEVYNTSKYKIETKSDDSPVTTADFIANDTIIGYLYKYFDNIPVLSEELPVPEYEERKKWDYYWCIDPLDGTKGFIRGSGEFTVNIALMKENKVVGGLIHVPVTKTSYFTDQGLAYRQKAGEGREKSLVHISYIEVSMLPNINFSIVLLF